MEMRRGTHHVLLNGRPLLQKALFLCLTTSSPEPDECAQCVNPARGMSRSGRNYHTSQLVVSPEGNLFIVNQKTALMRIQRGENDKSYCGSLSHDIWGQCSGLSGRGKSIPSGAPIYGERCLSSVRPPLDAPGTAQLNPVVLSSVQGSGGSLVFPCLQPCLLGQETLFHLVPRRRCSLSGRLG